MKKIKTRNPIAGNCGLINKPKIIQNKRKKLLNKYCRGFLRYEDNLSQ